tara:strand:+ start:50587 stop:50718 length:132 start_codon:yes stop_codon:yes gene_type:complete
MIYIYVFAMLTSVIAYGGFRGIGGEELDDVTICKAYVSFIRAA